MGKNQQKYIFSKILKNDLLSKGSFNNYVTQNYKILTYIPIFVTLF